MQYYNENPLVTYWRLKCEEVKKENERLNETLEKQFEWAAKRIEIERKKTDELKIKIQHFNSLPWWIRIFNKVKL